MLHYGTNCLARPGMPHRSKYILKLACTNDARLPQNFRNVKWGLEIEGHTAYLDVHGLCTASQKPTFTCEYSILIQQHYKALGLDISDRFQCDSGWMTVEATLPFRWQ